MYEFTHPTVLSVYMAEFVIAIMYSVFLQSIYKLYNPDYVIFTVAGGVLLSVSVPITLARVLPGVTWHQYEMWTAIAFCTSSIPVAIWQGWQVYMRHKKNGTAIKQNGKQNGEKKAG